MNHNKTAARMSDTLKWMAKFLRDCPTDSRGEAFFIALKYYGAMNEFLDRYEGGFLSLFKKNGYKSPYVQILLHMALTLHDEHELLETYMRFIPAERRLTYQKNGDILKSAKTAHDKYQ